MTIKERAHNAVKTAYAKYGLKADELTKIAENIAGGLKEETTDEELNAAVKGAEFYASLMQSVGNRKQTELENKYKGWQPPKGEESEINHPKSQEQLTEPTPPAQMITKEEIAKMIQDGIAAGIAPFEQMREKERLNSLLNGAEKLKDVPQSFRNRYSLDKEEDLDSVVDTISKDYQTLKQEMFKEGTIIEAPKQPTAQQEEDATIEMFKKINAPKQN